MRLKIGNPSDFGAGVLMLATGLFTIAFSWDLAHGTALNMGPGYFPRYVAGLLLVVGGALVWRSMRSEGALLFRLKIRPFVAVVSAIVFFSLFVRDLGLALTAFGTIVIASLASGEMKIVTTLLVAVGMAVTVCLVFIYGLGVVLPVWPQF